MAQPSDKIDRPVAALIAPDILEMLEESPSTVAPETEEMHPADLADVAEAMPRERIAEFLRALPPDRAAQVLSYIDEEIRSDLLEDMTTAQAVRLVTHMTPDDRADVLEELEQETADEILSEIPDAERRETEQLLAYEADTAGGLMTTAFVSVAQHLSVEQALEVVREAARSQQREAMHAIYVTDPAGALRGVLSLRELLAAPPGSSIGDVAWTEVVRVAATADRSQVAEVTKEYDLVAIPVVDASNRLIGVITVDDVIDVIVEEQTEDVQRLGAVQPLEEPYFAEGFWRLLRKRGGWLILLFVGEMFTGYAMRHFDSEIARARALTYFLPLITSSGGNSGSQSASLITRALAVGDVDLRDWMRVIFRELGQGLLLGIFLGSIGFVRALMWGNGQDIATVVALTLVLVVMSGTLVGAALPLFLTRLGFDPAVASSPFVASIVDVAGIFIYFSVALRILGL